MTAFAYTARDRDGRPRKGVIDAHSAGAAWRALRRADLRPERVTRADESRRWGWRSHRGRTLSHTESVSITRQLALLIAAGTPVERAVHTVSEAASARGRACLEAVRADVVQGKSVSEALAQAGFPSWYRAVVRAGEHGGGLGDALERLAAHLETSQNIRRQLLSALAYPGMLAVVALLVVGALMVVVVPRLAEHLVDLGRELPFLTRLILWLSRWIGTYGGAVAVVSVVGCYGALRLARAHPLRSAGLLWSLPVIGGLLRDVAAARFCRAFAALTHSGIRVAQALRIARQATQHPLARAGLRSIETAVDSGQNLGTAIERSGIFPKVVAQMIAGGQASGALAPLFDKSAEYLESRIAARTATFLAVLEPLIAVIMGIVVLIVVLAIMLPILRLNAAVLP